MADLFLRQQIIFGGEESACIAVKDHLPEKDGIFAGLLVAEMLALTGLPLTELQRRFFLEYGRKHGAQRDIPLNPLNERELRDLILNPPDRFAGRPVEAIERIDGIKFDLADDDWLLLRLSGTEPLIRCYAEAGTRKELNRLLDFGVQRLS
jgi:phosphoglucomutase